MSDVNHDVFEDDGFDEDAFDDEVLRQLAEAPRCDVCGTETVDGDCIYCLLEEDDPDLDELEEMYMHSREFPEMPEDFDY